MQNMDIDINNGDFSLTVRSSFLAIRNRCVLLIPHYYPDKTVWNLPGGKVRKLEDVKTAALRELKEETGLSAIITKLHSVTETIILDDSYQSILFTFLGDIGENQIILSEKHSSGIEKIAEWIPFDKAINLESNMDHIIKSIISGKDERYYCRDSGY